MNDLPFIALGFLCLLLLSVSAQEPDGNDPKPTVPEIRLVWLTDGLLTTVDDADPLNIPDLMTYKLGQTVRIDLTEPKQPILAAGFNGNRLFYVFFKQVYAAHGRRAYVVQRIKKTVRDWPVGEDEPEETITYQVEVFKTFGGKFKRPDQHYGYFSLRDEFTRREIIKEYDVGIGEIPDLCEGVNWPFEERFLFKKLQGYQEERGIFDDVTFLTQMNWSLRVAFSEDGTWQVASPELGFDAPKKFPDAARAVARPSPDTKGVVLFPGSGLEGLDPKTADLDDLKRVLGDPAGWTEFSSGASNVIFSGGLSANLNPKGKVYLYAAEADFGGRTDKGVRVGDSRFEVMEKMGTPRQSGVHAPTWRFGSVMFVFDAFDRVERMLIYTRAKSE